VKNFIVWLANEADSADSYVCWDMSVLSISDLRRVAKAMPLLVAACEWAAEHGNARAQIALAALKGDAP